MSRVFIVLFNDVVNSQDYTESTTDEEWLCSTGGIMGTGKPTCPNAHYTKPTCPNAHYTKPTCPNAHYTKPTCPNAHYTKVTDWPAIEPGPSRSQTYN